MKLSTYARKYSLTRRELARKLGVSHGAVCKWLSGERVPSPIFVSIIVKATKGEVGTRDLK
jgi:DNA-binding transcriptional regulator YdaS (Cro superfamily)